MARKILVVALIACAIGLGQACEEGEQKPNPNDDTSYIVCVHGEERAYYCPSGTKYNCEKKVCDWPENVKCDKGGQGGSESEMRPTTTEEPPAFVPHGPSPQFAPYFDVMIKGPTLSEVYEKTGQKDYTLAFVLGSHAGCEPKWGGELDLDDPKVIDEVRAIQGRGGEVIVATGGAAGPYLENSCGSVETLTAAYIKILDKVRTNHLDIDVEAPIDIDKVCKALANVQRQRPKTTVSFTLMVQAEEYGLNPDLGVKVLEGAKRNGVDVAIVNPMTMEFGGSSADWGDAVINAAKSVLRQMKEIWPMMSTSELKRMLGVTPMIGRNFNGKRFEPQHGRKLVQWANENRIGLLAFWSVGRDNGNCAGGGISPHCSSISQGQYEFTKIFQGFHT